MRLGRGSPEEVKAVAHTVRYSSLPLRNLAFYLNNCFSKVTSKDVVIRVYLTTYKPTYKIKKRKKVVQKVKCRCVPAIED